MPKWIEFRESILGPSTRNENSWNVVNKHSGAKIGEIIWYPQWKRYVLAPEDCTVWDEVCVRDVVVLCEHATAQHKGEPPPISIEQRNQNQAELILRVAEKLKCPATSIEIPRAINKLRETLQWYATATYPDDGSGRPPDAYQKRAKEALET